MAGTGWIQSGWIQSSNEEPLRAARKNESIYAKWPICSGCPMNGKHHVHFSLNYLTEV